MGGGSTPKPSGGTGFKPIQATGTLDTSSSANTRIVPTETATVISLTAMDEALNQVCASQIYRAPSQTYPAPSQIYPAPSQSQ